MAKITPADLFANDSTDRGPTTLEAMAPLATGLNKDGTAFQLDTALTTVPNGTAITTAAATAINDSVVLPVSSVGSATIVAIPSAVLTAGSIVFEASYDNQTTWSTIIGARQDAFGASASSLSWSSQSQQFAVEFGIPPAATHIRARVTVATAGGTLKLIAQGSAQFSEPVVVAGGSMTITTVGSGNSRVGYTGTHAINGTEAIPATLATLTSYNGTSFDLWQVAPGTAINTSGAFTYEFRAFSTADQTHLLGIEASDDNSTWDRVAEVTATSKANKYTAYADIKPVARYVRAAVYNSSASAFTFARLRTARLA